MIDFIIDFILHVDKYIAVFSKLRGLDPFNLFLIVFIETGL